jgi:hypothetical protein
MICNPIVTYEWVYDCNDDDDDSIVSDVLQPDIDYGRAIHVDDFYPSLGMTYDVSLVNIIHVNWDKEPNPSHNAWKITNACDAKSSHTVCTHSQELVLFDALDTPIKDSMTGI